MLCGPPLPVPRGHAPQQPTARTYAPQHPAWPHKVLPEVGFRDDPRPFAQSGWGLALLMGVCGVCGGSPQVRKLKVLCLWLDSCRIPCVRGHKRVLKAGP